MNSNSTPITQLARSAIGYVSDRDFDSLRAMTTADAVLEFPYHPNGPMAFQGVDALIKQQSVIRVFETFRFDIERIYETDHAGVAVVEARSRGTLRSGKPDYTNHYIFILEFRDGKLCRWCEFFNPLEAMKLNYGKPPQP